MYTAEGLAHNNTMKGESFLKVYVKGRSNLNLRQWLGVLGVLCLSVMSRAAETNTWNGGEGATWDTTSNNWTGVGISATPWNGVATDNWAIFDSADATPSVNGSVYVNRIVFSNTATIGGSGSITLNGASHVVTTYSNATINAPISKGSGIFTKNGTRMLTLSNATIISGESSVAGGTLNMAGGVFSLAGRFRIGGSSLSTFKLTGGAVTTGVDTSYTMLVGYKNAAKGQVTQEGGHFDAYYANKPSFISGGSSATEADPSTVGAYEISGGVFLTRTLTVGASGIGTLTQTGGAITNTTLYIGRYSASLSDGTGTVSIVGSSVSTLYAGTAMQLGRYGVGTMTISNSAAVVAINGAATLGTISPADGTLNLYAGTLRLTSLVKGTGTHTFNFSGGTLAPYNANATIGSATAANNTTITLTGTNATISSSDHTGAGRRVDIYSKLTGSGSITFTGNGTNIVIAADNDYSGNTKVNGGTVVWSNACLSANADLICTNSPKLILAFTGTNTIRKLLVNDFTEKPGIYNSANAPAGMTIQDTGALLVTETEPQKGAILIVE